MSPYLNELSELNLAECQRVYDIINEMGYNYLWITSVNPEYIHELQDQYYIFDEVYFGDELELKAMVRSNPGLILINDGIIIDKWSKIDFPQKEEINNLIETL